MFESQPPSQSASQPPSQSPDPAEVESQSPAQADLPTMDQLSAMSIELDEVDRTLEQLDADPEEVSFNEPSQAQIQPQPTNPD